MESNLMCVCPECKNSNPVDSVKYPNVEVGNVIECASCGTSLEVESVAGGQVSTRVVSSGK